MGICFNEEDYDYILFLLQSNRVNEGIALMESSQYDLDSYVADLEPERPFGM